MDKPTADSRALKQDLRRQALAARGAQRYKDRLSREICGKLAALPEYAGAETIMFYRDVRSEVRTRPFLATARRDGKRVVIPYCVQRRLELFRMESLDELAPSSFGILEPTLEWQARADRKVSPAELDLIVVPGVAFDRHGGRLGHGGGYYDKLLRQVREHTRLVALAFECQIIPQVPMLSHDVYIDKVITETGVYRTGGTQCR